MKSSSQVLTALLAAMTIGTTSMTIVNVLPQFTATTALAEAETPVTYDATVYINYTPGYGITVHTTPGGDTVPNKRLEDGTRWKTFEAEQLADGSIWYNLGGDQWIDAAYSAPYRVTSITDVGVIKYKPNYGIAVWTNPEATPFKTHTTIPNKTLEDGTRWKIFEKAVTENGHVWYSVGGAQWIDSSYVLLESENKTGWPFATPYNAAATEPDQKFGDTPYDRGGSPDPYFHHGFDFGSAIYGAGSTIKAITSGEVIYTGYYDGLYDVIVVKAPDGNEIIYQEFGTSASDIHVKVGEEVSVGQNIGKMTRDHLHISICTSGDWKTATANDSFNPKGPWLNPITYIEDGLAKRASLMAPVFVAPEAQVLSPRASATNELNESTEAGPSTQTSTQSTNDQ